MTTVSYEIREGNCEVCNECHSEMVRVTDTWEIPTTTQYRQWELRGPHHFCLEHARPSMDVYLDGRIFTRQQCVAQAEADVRRFQQQYATQPTRPDADIAACWEAWALGCQDIERRKAGVG